MDTPDPAAPRRFGERSTATLVLSVVAVLGAVVPKVCARFGWLGFSGANYLDRVYGLGLHPRAVLDQGWRWLTSWWMHGPVIYPSDMAHVAASVVVLQLLGPHLESRHGSLRLCLAFGLGLVAGSLAAFGFAPWPGSLGMLAGCCALGGLGLGSWLAGTRGKGEELLHLGYVAVTWGLCWFVLPHLPGRPTLAPAGDLAGLAMGVLLGYCWKRGGRLWQPAALCLLLALGGWSGWRAAQVRAVFPDGAPAEAERYKQLLFASETIAAKQALAVRRALLASGSPADSIHAASVPINSALLVALDTLASISQTWGEAGKLHQRLHDELGIEEATVALDDLRERIAAVNDPAVRIEVGLAQDFWQVLFLDFVAFLRLPAADLAAQRLNVELVGKLYQLVKAKAEPESGAPPDLARLEARHGFGAE